MLQVGAHPNASTARFATSPRRPTSPSTWSQTHRSLLAADQRRGGRAGPDDPRHRHHPLSLVPSPSRPHRGGGDCVSTEHEGHRGRSDHLREWVVAHILVSRVSERKLRRRIMERQRQITVNYETRTVRINRCVSSSDGQMEILEARSSPERAAEAGAGPLRQLCRDRRQPLVGIPGWQARPWGRIEVLRQIHDGPAARPESRRRLSGIDSCGSRQWRKVTRLGGRIRRARRSLG